MFTARQHIVIGALSFLFTSLSVGMGVSERSTFAKAPLVRWGAINSAISARNARFFSQSAQDSVAIFNGTFGSHFRPEYARPTEGSIAEQTFGVDGGRIYTRLLLSLYRGHKTFATYNLWQELVHRYTQEAATYKESLNVNDINKQLVVEDRPWADKKRKDMVDDFAVTGVGFCGQGGKIFGLPAKFRAAGAATIFKPSQWHMYDTTLGLIYFHPKADESSFVARECFVQLTDAPLAHAAGEPNSQWMANFLALFHAQEMKGKNILIAGHGGISDTAGMYEHTAKSVLEELDPLCPNAVVISSCKKPALIIGNNVGATRSYSLITPINQEAELRIERPLWETFSNGNGKLDDNCLNRDCFSFLHLSDFLPLVKDPQKNFDRIKEKTHSFYQAWEPRYTDAPNPFQISIVPAHHNEELPLSSNPLK